MEGVHGQCLQADAGHGIGLRHVPVARFVSHGDPSGLKSIKAPLEPAAASQVVGEGDARHTEVVLGGEDYRVAPQIGDRDLERNAEVTPEHGALCASQGLLHLDAAREAGGDRVAALLAQALPVGLAGGGEAVGPPVQGCKALT